MMNDELMTVSPYDDSFPMKLLEQAFKFRVEESREVTNIVVKNVFKSANIDLRNLKPGEEKVRLVVDASDEFIKDYQNGVIKLAKEKGKVVAQIKENGKYGAKLPIKNEVFLSGPDPLEIMTALQLQEIAESLQQLADQIQAIDENIKEVLRGQQNDRLGLYYSGVALYIEANRVSDEFFKKQLLSQSLKALTDAKYQLILTIQSDIIYLQRREYEADRKQKFNLLNEKITSINKAFTAIHQAMLMKAGIYCEMGEIAAMTSVFNEYAMFIKDSIVPNYKLLAQCDIRDTGKIDGTWSSRSKLLDEVTNIVNQLNITNNEIYIEYKEENTNESI